MRAPAYDSSIRSNNAWMLDHLRWAHGIAFMQPGESGELDEWELSCKGSYWVTYRWRRIINLHMWLVLATGPNSQVGSGCGSNPEPNCCNGFPHKPAPQESTFLAPIEYLSSDRITAWSIRRLCSFSRSFTSRIQICDPTSIRWIAVKYALMSFEFSRCVTTIQRISVGLQIWMQEVKERLKLDNLDFDHVMIRSKVRYLMGAKVVGTVEWNRGPVPTRPHTRWVPLCS